VTRIEFSTEGGLASFPGLARPVVIDADSLDKDEAAQLKKLIEAANFFDLPAVVGSPAKGSADYQYSILTIDNGMRRHSVRILDSAENPALQALLQVVRAHVKKIRAAQRVNAAKGEPGK
jgi:hypothetical protein